MLRYSLSILWKWEDIDLYPTIPLLKLIPGPELYHPHPPPPHLVRPVHVTIANTSNHVLSWRFSSSQVFADIIGEFTSGIFFFLGGGHLNMQTDHNVTRMRMEVISKSFRCDVTTYDAVCVEDCSTSWMEKNFLFKLIYSPNLNIFTRKFCSLFLYKGNILIEEPVILTAGFLKTLKWC